VSARLDARASELAPTPLLRVVLAGSAACLAAAWAGFSSLALAGSAGLAAAALAWLVARLAEPRISAAAPRASTATLGVETELSLVLRNESALVAQRDLWISVRGERITDYVGRLDPRAELVVRPRVRFDERGRVRSLRLFLRTSAPLGLFERRLTLEVPCDVLVVPRLGHLRAIDERFERSVGRVDASPRGVRGDGEFYGLREWRAGDSQRRVHWKLSARRGRKVMLDLRSEDRPRVELCLSCRVAAAPPSGRRHRDFERAVALTATLGERLLRRGHRVGLRVLGGSGLFLRDLHGRRGLAPLLAALAEVRWEHGRPTMPGLPGPRAERVTRAVVLCGDGAAALARRAEMLVFDASAPGIEDLFRPASARPRRAPQAGR